MRPTEPNRVRRLQDFLLAAQVEVALAKEGHNVQVDADDGAVDADHQQARADAEPAGRRAQIDRRARCPGVRSMNDSSVGKDYHQADVYRRFDFELPSKVLLVDDEREFVQTLSERLLMRDMGSAVAYDGESALGHDQTRTSRK
ncbi:MAG: hypothetical protein MZV65_17925 [Chromatiales bacterium]|nr:hypothetical protein [Chromatiales bacterium]